MDKNLPTPENPESDQPLDLKESAPPDEKEEEQKPQENFLQNTNANKLRDLIKDHIAGPFSEAVIERKNLSFELLKEWDQKKCDFLIQHKQLLESLFKKIEKKDEILKLSMTKVLKFFNQKAIQETEYLGYFQKKIPRLGDLYQEFLPVKKEENQFQTQNPEILKPDSIKFFPDFINAFERMDEVSVLKQKKHEEYKNYIEKTLISDILIKENKNYEKTTSELKIKINSIRKKLSKYANETAENSSKYAKLFQDMMNPLTRKNTENKDLYNSEIAIFSSSDEQLKYHRNLAEEILSYREELIKLENSRLKTIKQIFQDFLMRSEDFYGSSLEYENAKKGFNEINFDKDLDEFFDFKSLIKLEDLIFLKDYILNLLDLSLETLIQNLKSFEIKEIEYKPLLVKQYVVQRDKGTFSNDYKKCLLCFTVDNNILIFDDYKEGEKKQADYILKMESISAKPKNESGIIEIVEKVKGLIFNSNSSYYFKVEDQDIFDEIIYYVSFVKLRKWI